MNTLPSRLRQLYWLVAGDRNQLESTYLFHSIVASMSRRAGVFSEISPVPETDAELPHDVDIEWRYWAAKEVRRRTALCFIVNDLTFSQLFMQPAMASIGNVNWSLPTNDAMFTATTALEWKQLHGSKPQTQKSPPLHDLSASLFSKEPEAIFAMHAASQFSTHILVSSILSVVLSTRVTRTDLDEELSKHSFAQNPILKSLQAAWDAVSGLGGNDLFYSQTTWHAAWMQLTTDIRVIEVACGREGREAAMNASRQVSKWANVRCPLAMVTSCKAVCRAHWVDALSCMLSPSFTKPSPPRSESKRHRTSTSTCIRPAWSCTSSISSRSSTKARWFPKR
jgi:hypothetical protein